MKTSHSFAWGVRFNSILATLCIAGTALLGPGVAVWRCAAADCAGGVGPGGTFPSGPNNDNTQSMGVFQISVNSSFYGLFQANGSLVAYPGWNNSLHTVTSPVLYDNNTQIGTSAPESRFINFGTGIPIGTGTYGDTVSSYPPSIPPTPFVFAAPGTREVLTEIQTFTLALMYTNCGCGSAMVPCPPPGYTANMVMAGQHNPDLTLPPILPVPAGATFQRSVGLVQSQANSGANVGNTAYDFPASSFFDIFVEVNLPNASPPNYANTVSTTAFPPTGAALYSDPTQPLIVQDVPPNSDANNPAVCSLPPRAVYIHGANTFAPNLYFALNGPINPVTHLPYYSAGDILGSVVLAGHGVLTPCDPPTPNEELLITATLGTSNQAKPWMPIGWLFPDPRFPWPTATYDSLPGTNLGGGSVDAVSFPINTSALWLRGLSLSNFVNSTNLPPYGSSVVYTNPVTSMTCELSIDGTNYFPGTASGPMQILISNTNPPVGDVTNYSLQMLQLTLTGSTFFGNFYLNQDSNTVSSGSHIVRTGPSGGYQIGSYLDLALTISTDNQNFFSAARTLHVQQENAPCGAATEQLHVTPSGSSVIVWWRNPSYTLQGSPTLSPTAWVSIPGTSPITNAAAGPYKFYRLTCD
jgi:hypothetical protein